MTDKNLCTRTTAAAVLLVTGRRRMGLPDAKRARTILTAEMETVAVKRVTKERASDATAKARKLHPLGRASLLE